MKTLKRLALLVGSLAVVGYLFISWTLSSKVLFPDSSLEKTKNTIKEYWGTTYEEVLSDLPTPEPFIIQSFDQVDIRGRYFSTSDSAACVIIFAHGWGETWAGMLKYVPAFDDCACDFVMYDHRVHGESGGKYATGGIYESKDLLSVTDWVIETKGFDSEQIGWMGSSWGGATALMAGATNINVAFIVVDAPFQDWNLALTERAVRSYGSNINLIMGGVMGMVALRSGINPREANAYSLADQIDEPVLIIHSKSDSATAVDQSVQIASQLNSRSQAFFTEWGNDHVMDVINNKADFRSLVTAFIAENEPTFLIQKEQ